MIRLGVTGHQRLADAAAWAWARVAIDRVLGERLLPVTAVSSLAEGADQLVTELVLARGGALELVQPFPEYGDGFAGDEPRARYQELRARAARVAVLERAGRSDEEAYLHAGQAVVDASDLVLALWNGAPAAGLGGTGDVVAYARKLGRPLVIVNPVTRTVSREGAVSPPASVETLGDAALDRARGVGDPILDPIIAAHVARLSGPALGALMQQLFRSSALPLDQPLVAAVCDALAEPALGDAETIARGQRLFALFGPEMFLVLGSCSLPLAFAAGNGVQAIHRARRLKDDPVRRLYDTAQMIINVMQVGGLAPGGVGWRSARKVRLIHALIRHHVQSKADAPWSAAWGVPINQEDLAGTLLSFSVAVLHGLERMGARISTADADAFVYTWGAIGRLLGVDEALLARDAAGAKALAFQIGRRQVRETPEGKELAGQLLGAVATLFPIPGYANSLTHFFLRDSAFGDDVARVLGLPPADWTRVLVAARAVSKRAVLAALEWVPGARGRRSFLARRFVQAMLLLKRPDDHAPFEVPRELAGLWGVRSGAASAAGPGGPGPVGMHGG